MDVLARRSYDSGKNQDFEACGQRDPLTFLSVGDLGGFLASILVAE